MDSRGVESKDTIKGVALPVALQPRSNVQLQHTAEAKKSEDLLDGLQIKAELKEILKK